jgi:hypothetical protein
MAAAAAAPDSSAPEAFTSLKWDRRVTGNREEALTAMANYRAGKLGMTADEFNGPGFLPADPLQRMFDTQQLLLEGRRDLTDNQLDAVRGMKDMLESRYLFNTPIVPVEFEFLYMVAGGFY